MADEGVTGGVTDPGQQTGGVTDPGQQTGGVTDPGQQTGGVTDPGQQAGGVTDNLAGDWYKDIEDEGVRAFAQKFGSEEEFFTGLKSVGIEFDKEGNLVENAAAPEKYTDFEVPDGVTISDEGLKNFSDMAKKLDLNQEGAQELLNFQLASVQQAVQQSTEQFDAMTKGWLDDARKDKEIGGAVFKEKVEKGKLALQKFGNAELTKVLDLFGLGNHPEVIRFLSSVGSALGEDSIVPGGKGGETISLGKRIFPNMK